MSTTMAPEGEASTTTDTRSRPPGATTLLCLDVQQVIISYLGIDLSLFFYTTELTKADALVEGPKSIHSRNGSRRSSKKSPSKKCKSPQPSLTEAQCKFPWLSCSELNVDDNYGGTVTQVLTTVQLISRSWQQAFQSTVLDADHIVVYRALLVRRKLMRFQDAADDFQLSASRHGLDRPGGEVAATPKPAVAVPQKGKGKEKATIKGKPKASLKSDPADSFPPLYPKPSGQALSLLRGGSQNEVENLVAELEHVRVDLKEVLVQAQLHKDSLDDHEERVVAEVLAEFSRASKDMVETLSHMRQGLTELKSYLKPATQISNLFQIICSMQKRKSDWETAKKMICEPTFISWLQDYPDKLRCPLERKRLARINNEWSGVLASSTVMRGISSAAAAICEWYEFLVATNDNIIKMSSRQSWLDEGASSPLQDSEDPFFLDDKKRGGTSTTTSSDQHHRSRKASAEVRAANVWENECRHLLETLGADRWHQTTPQSRELSARIFVEADEREAFINLLQTVQRSAPDQLRIGNNSVTTTTAAGATTITPDKTSSPSVKKPTAPRPKAGRPAAAAKRTK